MKIENDRLYPQLESTAKNPLKGDGIKIRRHFGYLFSLFGRAKLVTLENQEKVYVDVRSLAAYAMRSKLQETRTDTNMQEKYLKEKMKPKAPEQKSLQDKVISQIFKYKDNTLNAILSNLKKDFDGEFEAQAIKEPIASSASPKTEIADRTPAAIFQKHTDTELNSILTATVNLLGKIASSFDNTSFNSKLADQIATARKTASDHQVELEDEHALRAPKNVQWLMNTLPTMEAAITLISKKNPSKGSALSQDFESLKAQLPLPKAVEKTISSSASPKTVKDPKEIAKDTLNLILDAQIALEKLPAAKELYDQLGVANAAGIILTLSTDKNMPMYRQLAQSHSNWLADALPRISQAIDVLTPDHPQKARQIRAKLNHIKAQLPSELAGVTASRPNSTSAPSVKKSPADLRARFLSALDQMLASAEVEYFPSVSKDLERVRTEIFKKSTLTSREVSNIKESLDELFDEFQGPHGENMRANFNYLLNQI